MKLPLILTVTTIICCVSMQASLLEVVPELINEQINFLERVILMSGTLAKERPDLTKFPHVNQQKLLLHKCCSMLDGRINYFMRRTNNIKRGLIDLVYRHGTAEEEESRKILERESIALSLEMKQFFFRDLRNHYNEVGRGMNISDYEIEKNFKIVSSMFAEGMGAV